MQSCSRACIQASWSFFFFAVQCCAVYFVTPISLPAFRLDFAPSNSVAHFSGRYRKFWPRFGPSPIMIGVAKHDGPPESRTLYRILAGRCTPMP
jgi:hypothetical protein